MPQPAEVEQLTAELLRLYRASWDRITTAEQHLINTWTGLRLPQRLARLRELRAVVEQLMDAADTQALRFVQADLPQAYLLGAAAVGVTVTSWAQPDLDAINVLANDTYTGLLDATTFVRATTKDLIRELAKEHMADKLIRGQTAEQAGRELAAALEGRGIAAVTYKDGSRHGLADYADMLARTKTAEAYSVSSLHQIQVAGIGFVEVFDGIGCGWEGHDDLDKANGTVRAIDEAMRVPLSHPRCRRAFAGRPDVTTAGQARSAQPSTTPEQQADQAAAEARRALDVAARASNRAFEMTVQRRADALLSDETNRVRSAAHARVLARRQLVQARQARRVRRPAG
jgi:hypothetical protein